ncbi:WhiB family transcriptional regulator [Streptomyces sp. NPDC006193]|uniref:WhiB family transcriptional regulator n=1 Tax=Streptomyces sp. NPDC006193 TaxID=3155717 RepID=UPI0033B0D303
MNWRGRAACRNEDPELFFPIGDTGPAAQQTEKALAVCRSCPVLAPCRTWALTHGETDGIWGATTAAERRSLRRRIDPAGARAGP